MSPEIEAAKVMVDKPVEVLGRGEGIRHLPIDPVTIRDMRATLLAEYETAILVEIDDADLDHAAAQADRAFLRMIVHEEYDRIQFNGFQYDSGSPCPDLRADQVLDSIPDGEGLWVVQMIGPPTPQWHETLRSAGTVISAFPENTFIVRGERAKIQTLHRAIGFQHVEPFQPGFKVQTRLARAPGKARAIVQLDTGQDLEEALQFIEGMADRRFSRETTGQFRHLLVEITPEQALQLGQRPEVTWIEPYTKPGFSDERHAMVVAGEHDGDRPNDLGDPDTKRYQEWLESVGFCGDPPAQGCISYSTKVAVVDSGVDYNYCLTYDPYLDPVYLDTYNSVTGECIWSVFGQNRHHHHEDISEREIRFFCLETDHTGNWVDQCFSRSPTGAETYTFSDTYSHGTMVASLIGGDPLNGTNALDPALYLEGTGIAPKSEIVVAKFSSVWDPTPDHYERLIGRVFSVGTRFANNSWNEYANWLGGTDPYWPNQYHVVEYNLFSRMADSLVRDGDGGFDDPNNGITLVFSAGNYRWWQPDNNPDPNPDYLTVAPGNAKNIISVGSSFGWEEEWEDRGCCADDYYPDDPTCGDQVDDISDILYSSTRGTHPSGGRIKPDIVAPGKRLRAASESDISGPSSEYRCFGGTSGAAPLVTGAAILTDAWVEHHDPGHRPSPALVKAMLVAHAQDLGSGEKGESGTDRYSGQALSPSPSIPQGWGRLELETLFSPGVEVVWLDEDHSYGGFRRFTTFNTTWSDDFEVDDPSEDVIVVMAFTDVPGTPGPPHIWVNNLNLTVIDQDPAKNAGAPRYYGNMFSLGSWYSHRYKNQFPPVLSPINNVEVVRVPGADFVNGDFVISVTAKTLADKAVPGLDGYYNNQDFALYVVNASGVGP